MSKLNPYAHRPYEAGAGLRVLAAIRLFPRGADVYHICRVVYGVAIPTQNEKRQVYRHISNLIRLGYIKRVRLTKVLNNRHVGQWRALKIKRPVLPKKRYFQSLELDNIFLRPLAF